jgi:bifunctional isochorismate lyase/aryl carrier protein
MSGNISQGLPGVAPYEPPTEAEIPAARADWRLETGRAALLIHDMQRYFLRPYDLSAEPIVSAVPRIAALAERCRALGVPVFYTAQQGDQDRRDRGLQADLWGPGMTSAREHQDVIPELSPQAGDFVLVKHRYSAFQRSNLETLMRARGRDQLLICGVYGHIGCLMTAGEAFQRDIEPFLVADALGDFSREEHMTAVTYVAGRCGVSLSARQALEALN